MKDLAFGGIKIHISHLFPFLYTRQRRVVVCRAICPDVRLSVRPTVNFSCPLHNSDTIQDIFMKLGTNINHYQTMCREQEPLLHLHFLWNYGPLKFFLRKSCPLYNFDTIQNIFMKLCRNINYHQTMCREKKVTPPSFFYGIMPL